VLPTYLSGKETHSLKTQCAGLSFESNFYWIGLNMGADRESKGGGGDFFFNWKKETFQFVYDHNHVN